MKSKAERWKEGSGFEEGATSGEVASCEEKRMNKANSRSEKQSLSSGSRAVR